jgi:hypothetical protein
MPALAFLFFAFLTHAADYILIIQLAIAFLRLFSFNFIIILFRSPFTALIRFSSQF